MEVTSLLSTQRQKSPANRKWNVQLEIIWICCYSKFEVTFLFCHLKKVVFPLKIIKTILKILFFFLQIQCHLFADIYDSLAKNWQKQKVKNEVLWQQCTQLSRGNLMPFVVMGFRFLATRWQILQLVIYRYYHKKLSFVVLKSDGLVGMYLVFCSL